MLVNTIVKDTVNSEMSQYNEVYHTLIFVQIMVKKICLVAAKFGKVH